MNQDTKIPVVDNSAEEKTKNMMPGNLPDQIAIDNNNTPKLEAQETAQVTQDDVVNINNGYDTEENKEEK